MRLRPPRQPLLLGGLGCACRTASRAEEPQTRSSLGSWRVEAPQPSAGGSGRRRWKRRFSLTALPASQQPPWRPRPVLPCHGSPDGRCFLDGSCGRAERLSCTLHAVFLPLSSLPHVWLPDFMKTGSKKTWAGDKIPSSPALAPASQERVRQRQPASWSPPVSAWWRGGSHGQTRTGAAGSPGPRPRPGRERVGPAEPESGRGALPRARHPRGQS